LAKLDTELADNLKSKKPRPGSPYHYARPKGGGVAVRANPKPHKVSRPEKSWQYDFGCIARHSKMPAPLEFDDSVNDTNDTGWYYRDIFHSAASGKLIRDCGKAKMTTPTARVSRATAQNVPNGSDFLLTPDTKIWDNNVFWNPLAQSDRLTIRSCGLYLAAASLYYNGISGGNRQLILKVNATDVILRESSAQPNTELKRFSASTIWYFNEDDYLQAYAFANTNNVTCQLAALWILAITPEVIL